jgi:hypothetical protein
LVQEIGAVQGSGNVAFPRSRRQLLFQVGRLSARFAEFAIAQIVANLFA